MIASALLGEPLLRVAPPLEVEPMCVVSSLEVVSNLEVLPLMILSGLPVVQVWL